MELSYMIDNKENILFRNLNLKRVQFSQFKEFNCEQDLTPLQTRMYYLMINGLLLRGENESLYGWCGRIGLSNSTIFGIFKKNNKNMHLSVARTISNATGARIEWIQKGIGEPFPTQKQADTATQHEKEATPPKAEQKVGINADLLAQAFDALEDALIENNKQMPPKGRARFISALYEALSEEDGVNMQILSDCIFTAEEALNLKRRAMSPKSKTRLILAIYEMYSDDPAYQDVMQSTIKQLVGTIYE